MGVFARPVVDVTKGQWKPSTGSDLFGTVDEEVADDSDFIQSASRSGITDTCELKLTALADPLSSRGHVIRYRIGKSIATANEAVAMTVRLMQGGTEIALWTHGSVSDTPTTIAQELTQDQANAITDYADLRLHFQSTAIAAEPEGRLTEDDDTRVTESGIARATEG